MTSKTRHQNDFTGYVVYFLGANGWEKPVWIIEYVIAHGEKMLRLLLIIVILYGAWGGIKKAINDQKNK